MDYRHRDYTKEMERWAGLSPEEKRNEMRKLEWEGGRLEAIGECNKSYRKWAFERTIYQFVIMGLGYLVIFMGGYYCG